MNRTQELAEARKLIAELSAREHLLPLLRQMQAGRLLVTRTKTTYDEKDYQWPDDLFARIPVPVAVIIDDSVGLGPIPCRATRGAKMWLKAAYVAAGCTPLASGW
jgi:hypothetical protein